MWAAVAPSAERAASSASPSAASTRPPGNTCMPAAKAIVAGRWVSSTSGPRAVSRSTTTVAAGIGTAGSWGTAVRR